MKSIIKTTYDLKNPKGDKRELFKQFRFSSNDADFYTVRQFVGDFEILPISLKTSPPDSSTDSKAESAPTDELKEPTNE